MDPVQLTIIIISFILAILFVFLGIQVFFILREMRTALQKMNKMLDDAGKMTGTVSSAVEGVGGLLSGVKAGFSLFSGMSKRSDKDEE